MPVRKALENDPLETLELTPLAPQRTSGSKLILQPLLRL
jgi:hypothetical protein